MVVLVVVVVVIRVLVVVVGVLRIVLFLTAGIVGLFAICMSHKEYSFFGFSWLVV